MSINSILTHLNDILRITKSLNHSPLVIHQSLLIKNVQLKILKWEIARLLVQSKQVPLVANIGPPIIKWMISHRLQCQFSERNDQFFFTDYNSLSEAVGPSPQVVYRPVLIVYSGATMKLCCDGYFVMVKYPVEKCQSNCIDCYGGAGGLAPNTNEGHTVMALLFAFNRCGLRTGRKVDSRKHHLTQSNISELVGRVKSEII